MSLLHKKLISIVSLSAIIFQSFLPLAGAQSLYDQTMMQVQAQAEAIKAQAQVQIQNAASAQNFSQSNQTHFSPVSIADILAKTQALKDQSAQKTETVSSEAQSKIDAGTTSAQTNAQTQQNAVVTAAQNTITEGTAAAQNLAKTKTQAVLDSTQNGTALPSADNSPPAASQTQPSKYTGVDGDVSLSTGQISTQNEVTNNVNFNKAKAMLEQMQNSYDQITTVFNDNENNINNKMETMALSGRNLIERNDGAAEILSGKVVVNAAAITKNNVNNVDTPNQGNDVSNQVTNQNKSVVENLVELIGDSGFNKIDTNDGRAKIDTGAVDIRLNLLNLTNTNIINSEWGQLFYQSFEPLNQDFDLAKGWKQAARNDCALGACEGEFKVNNINEAVLNNKVKILGNSGGNEIIDSDGDGIIRTGDVKVSANLINFLNTNMTRSKWRLAVLNIFDDWKGDLILPGADRFDSNENDYNLFPNSKISTENDSNIKNSVIIETNTGQNEIISNDGKFNIKTGTSVVKSNVSTIGNITFTGGDWYLVFINTFGGWRGYAVNIPEDIGTAQTEQGIIFSSLLSKAVLGNLKNIKNDDGKLEMMTENVAQLNNELLIQALTGNNKIKGVDGDAEIQTGNTLVLSNIFNFVNTTMYGGKWNLALINVFGNWEGNITFGRPNLKLTSVTQSPVGELRSGDAFSTKLIYENSGTADASAVVLKSSFDPKLFRVIASSYGAQIDELNGKITWNINKLKRGSSGEASFTLQALAKTAGLFYTKITSSIYGSEREWDLRDNNIETSLKVKVTQDDITAQTPPSPAQTPSPQPTPQNSNNSQNNNGATSQNGNSNNSTQNQTNQLTSSGGGYQPNINSQASSPLSSSTVSQPEIPKVIIEKTNNAKGALSPNDLVNYSIILKNLGNIATGEIIVKDTFKDPSGKIISQDEYPIISLQTKEGTAIEYSIVINPLMPSGKYTNIATAYIKNSQGKIVSTISASSTIEVVNNQFTKSLNLDENIGSNKDAVKLSSEAVEPISTPVNNQNLSKNFVSKTADIFSLSKTAKATTISTSQKTAKKQTEKSPVKSDIQITRLVYKEERNPVLKAIAAGSNLLDALSAHLPRLVMLFGIWQVIANIHGRVYTGKRKRR